MLVNSTEIHRFKAKDFELIPYSLCLGKISKNWSTDNIKKTGLKVCVYDFSTDYNYIPVFDIFDIHKYLMEKMELYNTTYKNLQIY